MRVDLNEIQFRHRVYATERVSTMVFQFSLNRNTLRIPLVLTMDCPYSVTTIKHQTLYPTVVLRDDAFGLADFATLTNLQIGPGLLALFRQVMYLNDFVRDRVIQIDRGLQRLSEATAELIPHNASIVSIGPDDGVIKFSVNSGGRRPIVDIQRSQVPGMSIFRDTVLPVFVAPPAHTMLDIISLVQIQGWTARFVAGQE